MKTVEDDFDPMELMRRKNRILYRFRAMVRLVADNVCWMKEEHFLRGVTDRVRKSIFDTLKKITVTKQILSLEDKIILYNPVSWRDDATNKHLNRLIGGLKFFRPYPKNARRKLSSVTLFKSYGAHRVILRQGHMAHAMYFIVDGKIEKRDDKGLFDSILMFGDTMGVQELYYEEPHTFTYTSLTPVQLLCVEKEYFTTILSNTLQKHWSEVRHAMSLFNYFSEYTEKTIREACLVAKLKCFKPKELVYGDGVGEEGFVYFIYSGKCQVIASLLVRTIQKQKKTFYSLHTQAKITEKFYSTCSSENYSVDNENTNQESRVLSHYLDELRGLKAKNVSEFSSKPSLSMWSKTESYTNYSHKLSPNKLRCYSSLPKNVHLVFMQVCLLNEGGCFNMGESYEDRRIVSTDEVKCLLLPRTWIWENNFPGFWSKIKWYLERHIPSKQEIFEEYKLGVEWEKYKEDIFEDLLRTKLAQNITRVHDVPLTVRVNGNFKCPDRE